MSKEEALCRYLKEGNFHAFMEGWRRQYERLGRLGGRIRVTLDEQSREDIAGLLGEDYHGKATAEISYHALKRALDHSRFQGVDMEAVLHSYFQDTIIPDKVRKSTKQEAIQTMLKRCASTHIKAKQWLTSIIDAHTFVYTRIMQEYTKDAAACEVQVKQAADALDALPMWKGEHQSMALFAGAICGDPHAFDKQTFCFYLLYQAICYFLHTDASSKGLVQHDILWKAGLYQDGVNNYCVMARLCALDLQGRPHDGWRGFYDRYEALNVHMDNLLAIKAIDRVEIKRALIVENPSVFQALLAFGKANDYRSTAYVCTYGQLNYAGYLLLDLLAQGKIKMYYSGDMDAEGLLIADKLKERYGDNLCLWRYDETDYRTARSQKAPGERQKAMLDKLKDPQLCMIGACLRLGTNGYQENMLQLYLDDLRGMEISV